MPERYIDPNSGAATQPGGFVTPGATESEPRQEDFEAAAKSQIQDDPAGAAAVDPDARNPDITDDVDQDGQTLEGEERRGEQGGEQEGQPLTSRTGETVNGEGDTVVSEDQADGQVSAAPGTVGTEQPSSAITGEGEATGDQSAGEERGEDEDDDPDAEVPPGAEEEVDPEDPGKSGVAQVKKYLEKHPDKREQVLKAEREGKKRKGILDA